VDHAAARPFRVGAVSHLLGWAARHWDDLQEEAGAAPLELMPMRRALPFLYRRLVRGLSEETRLEVDALLGDPVAQATLQAQRREAIALMDAEIA